MLQLGAESWVVCYAMFCIKYEKESNLLIFSLWQTIKDPILYENIANKKIATTLQEVYWDFLLNV